MVGLAYRAFEYYAIHYVLILKDWQKYCVGFCDGLVTVFTITAVLVMVLGGEYSFPFLSVAIFSAASIALRRYSPDIAVVCQIITALFTMGHGMAAYANGFNQFIAWSGL